MKCYIVTVQMGEGFTEVLNIIGPFIDDTEADQFINDHMTGDVCMLLCTDNGVLCFMHTPEQWLLMQSSDDENIN